MEAASGFEPLNRGFADLRLGHLATPPRSLCVNIARTKVRGSLERKEPEPLSPGAWPCGSRLPLRRPPDIGEASTASTTVVSTAEVSAQGLVIAQRPTVGRVLSPVLRAIIPERASGVNLWRSRPPSLMGRVSAREALMKAGAGNGIRTRDPDLGKVVLYH